MLLSENLRFLLERAQTLRWQALHHGGHLRFPSVPTSPAELSRQGFVVVPPGRFEPGEPDTARAYWSSLEVQPFYGQAKPWATWMADIAQEIRAESVLEFGCNRGRNLVTIREARPRARIVGLDINADAVASGKAEHDLDLRVGGEEDLKMFEDDAFDFVFTVSVLDHIADIDRALEELVRVCRRHLLLLEVRLPVEGKVMRHFDHKENAVRDSTTASYSWHLEKRLADYPKVARLDTRPVYLHDASLGPCYVRFLATMGRHNSPED
jgi:SAM-dependent methyltransferase